MLTRIAPLTLVQVLESDSVSGIGGMIIFVSATTENDAGDWTVKVIPWLETNAVAVNTVIFGSGNDSMFGHLSRSTRGESSVFSGLLPITPLAIQTELEVLFLRFMNARTTEWKQAVKVSAGPPLPTSFGNPTSCTYCPFFVFHDSAEAALVFAARLNRG